MGDAMNDKPLNKLVVRDSTGRVLAERVVPHGAGLTTTMREWLASDDWPGLCAGMTISVELDRLRPAVCRVVSIIEALDAARAAEENDEDQLHDLIEAARKLKEASDEVCPLEDDHGNT